MPSTVLLVGLAAMALWLPSQALEAKPKGKKGKVDMEQSTPTTPVETPVLPPVPTHGHVFTESVPFGLGALPEGLANTSAAGCNACHFNIHDQWIESGHATGWSSPALNAATEKAGSPICMSCHLPLADQHPMQGIYDGGDIFRPLLQPNPNYDPILHSEGVTCAACHIRDGVILTARPVDNAPHPTAWSKDLKSSLLCAACHQMTWPGSNGPFYNTWGEWNASAYSEAGVECQDCHMSSIDAGTPDHRSTPSSSRAVSLIARMSNPVLVRGAGSNTLEIRLQNTGAGHSFPTGSPFKGALLRIELVHQNEHNGKEKVLQKMDTLFIRTLDEQAPWSTIDDTRLQAGEERTLSWEFELPVSAPKGTYTLDLRIIRTIGKNPTEETPILSRRIPLIVR